MISKVYEDKYGLIKWNCITSDLEVAKTNPIYLADKATGSLIINIQEPSNSLIWDNENKEWIPYSVNGGGISNEELKTLVGDKVNELIESGEIIPDKSINASKKIINGTITQELLDTNINLGGGASNEEIKALAGEKVQELITSGELKSQIITDKSINANEKIVDGTITKELLDDNIKLEISEAPLQFAGFLYNSNKPNEAPAVGDNYLVYESFFNRTPKNGETCIVLYLDCRTGWQYYVKAQVDIRTGNKTFLVIKEIISCISSEMSLNVKKKVTAGTYKIINKYTYFLITETNKDASVTFTLPEATEKKDFDKTIVIENPNNIPIIFPKNVIWLNKEPKSCEGFTFIQVMRTYGNDVKWIGRIYQENDKGELNTDLIQDSVVTLQEGINYVDMVTDTTINLPVVNKYTEIRLWFKCTEDLSIVFPAICWQNEPETYAGYIYEYVFTYIPNLNEWVGGFVSYEAVI